VSDTTRSTQELAWLNWLKVLAVISMVVDHVDAVVGYRCWPLLCSFGRLSLPLFAFTAAASFARLTRDRKRYLVRLFLAGVLTQPIFVWATGADFLNILFLIGGSLLACEACESLFRTTPVGHKAAWFLAGLAGLGIAFVSDYSYWGAGGICLFYTAFRMGWPVPAFWPAAAGFCVTAAGSRGFEFYALLAAFPALGTAQWGSELPPIHIPKNFLLVFYGAHLAILKLIVVWFA
jgi:hypothetical protein